MQDDGQLGVMLAEPSWLRQVLQRLAGDEAGQHREEDEQAREGLAEAVLLLVVPLAYGCPGQPATFQRLKAARALACLDCLWPVEIPLRSNHRITCPILWQGDNSQIGRFGYTAGWHEHNRLRSEIVAIHEGTILADAASSWPACASTSPC